MTKMNRNKADQVSQVLDAVPKELLSQHRFVEHYFYGPESKLRRVRARIKRTHADATFDLGDQALVVTTIEQLDQDALHATFEAMESYAANTGVEYDGFGVPLVDSAENRLELIEPFEKHFSPETYVRFPLDDARFGYILFLGGNMKDGGYLFDCLRLVDDGDATTDDLDKAPRLYHQPVQGMIDPLQVKPVGQSKTIKRPLRVRFRMETDFPTPEEHAEIVMAHGFDPAQVEQDWRPFFEHLRAAGQNLRRGIPNEYTAVLGLDNRISWVEGGPIEKTNTASLPMPFGSFVRINHLKEALIGGHDHLALIDEVT